MTDHPIIFSGQMVRALLDGRKTMSRRLAWREKPCIERRYVGTDDFGKTRNDPSPWQNVKPGDRLYVREAFLERNWVDDKHGIFNAAGIAYRADIGPSFLDYYRRTASRSRPSIHMPRAASRLTLTVTGARLERIQHIFAEDILAEGVLKRPGWTLLHAFQMLWGSLHGHLSWDENPEVVALTFTVAKRNIDAPEAV